MVIYSRKNYNYVQGTTDISMNKVSIYNYLKDKEQTKPDELGIYWTTLGENSWLTFLFQTLLLLLAILFLLTIYKFVISYISKSITECSIKLYTVPYEIDDHNSITLYMRKCNKREYFPEPYQTSKTSSPQSFGCG